MPPTVSTSNRKKSKETSRENALRDNQASRIPTRALAVRRFVNGPSALIAAVVWVSGALVAIALHEELHRSGLVPLALLVSVLVGSFLLFSIKVVDQWEKAVVLRLGKYRGLRGPGVFWIVPVVNVISHLVDQRVRATEVTAQAALTRDNVPIGVDAIVFWLVWDAQKAVLEVQSYVNAILLSSQAALREAIEYLGK